jgi:predicted O-methyltransferase YrrM
MKKIIFLIKSKSTFEVIFFFLLKNIKNIFFKNKFKKFKLLHREFLKNKKITEDYFSLNAYNFHLCLSKIKNNFKYLEIGSYEGNSALFVANNFKNCDLICCLDTWKGSDEHTNYNSEVIEKNFDNNLKDYNNINKIKDSSDNFFLQNNNKFEVIYIDGSHLASQVYKDCMNAWRILKKNGFLICDDYIWHYYRKIKDNPCFAINTFLRTIKNQYKIFIVTNNQLFIKKII